MAGTKLGGKKAAATNKARHGKDFYRKMGAKGGSAEHKTPRYFAANRDVARLAGAKGGRISKRGPNKPRVEEPNNGWVNQTDQNSINSKSTSSGMYPCASCGELFAKEQLDEARLCLICPEPEVRPKKRSIWARPF